MKRGRRWALTAVLAGGLAAAIGGCAVRERLNPLDPANSETGGAIPGFVAIAGDGVVQLRWTRLSQPGVVAYAIERWKPGSQPAPLPGAVFPGDATAADDFGVQNESTYVYRLIARFSHGDSALSPPDTATAGRRYIAVLSAGAPAVFVLSPDARVVVAAIASENAYADYDIDRGRGVLWLSDPSTGAVLRLGLYGDIAGPSLAVPGVSGVSVSNPRGIGWVASPDYGRLQAYGPSLTDVAPRLTVSGLGRPRVVAAGTLDPTVWVGTDEGAVMRLNPSDGSLLERWDLGAPVRAIALDETARAAWVATLLGTSNHLHYLAPGDTTTAPKRTGLDNVADIEVEPVSRSLWVSERGRPRAAAGRISRIALDGSTIASRAGFEPYGIAVEPGSDRVWVSDLTSNRVLQLDGNANERRRSPPISVPYGVLVNIP